MLNDRIEISTPERVTVAYELAGVGSRMLAQAIDALIVLAIVIGIITAAGTLRGSLALAIAIGGVTLTPVGYFLVVEWLRRGSTPGKAALRLRVVSAGGEPLGLQDSAVRTCCGSSTSCPSPTSSAASARSSRARGSGSATWPRARSSCASRTSARPGRSQAPSPPPLRPPGAIRVPPELMAIAVSFRRRLRRIEPVARAELAARITARIEPYWARPEGMGEEEYVIRAATHTLPGAPRA